MKDLIQKIPNHQKDNKKNITPCFVYALFVVFYLIFQIYFTATFHKSGRV